MRLWQHDRYCFQSPPMPACRYIEENSLVAILASKRLAGVTPDVNLIEHVKHMPLLTVNKVADYGFETQKRCRQSLKQGYKCPQKDLCPTKKIKIEN